MTKRPTNYAWILNSNPKSVYSARDIYEVFGYCNPESLTSAVTHGHFPKKDVTIQIKFGPKLTRWSRKVVINEIRRRLAVSNSRLVTCGSEED